jgi:hypothetical protein
VACRFDQPKNLLDFSVRQHRSLAHERCSFHEKMLERHHKWRYQMLNWGAPIFDLLAHQAVGFES